MNENTSVEQHKDQLLKSLPVAHEQVKKNVITAQLHQAAEYNKKMFEIKWEENQLVSLDNPVIEQNKSKKLTRTWTGPYKIIQVITKENIIIQHINNPEDEQKVNSNRLKRWEGILAERDKEFVEIEDILEMKHVNDDILYLVKFRGYSKKHNEWVSQDNLKANEALQRFQVRKIEEDKTEKKKKAKEVLNKQFIAKKQNTTKQKRQEEKLDTTELNDEEPKEKKITTRAGRTIRNPLDKRTYTIGELEIEIETTTKHSESGR